MRLSRRLYVLMFGALLVVALSALRVADPYPVEAAREITFDLYQRLAPRPAADYPVRIVDIDDASLAEIGQWPWPRDKLAELTTRLAEMGAAAVVFDMLFPEPDRLSPAAIAASLPPGTAELSDLPDYDALFANALARTPSVIGFAMSTTSDTLPERAKAGIAISGEDPTQSVPRLHGAVLPLPQFVDAAAGLGLFSLNTTGSVATVRRMPLLWSTGDQLMPALSVESLRVAFGVSTLVVLGETAGAPYVEALRIGDLTVPTTSSGELWLYFRPLPPEIYVPAADILGDGYRDHADKIAGQIVLIGTSASGLSDMRGTPLGGGDVPGVTIHAQAIEQMLGQNLLSRADYVQGLELLAFVVIGGALVLIISRAGPLVGLLAIAALTLTGVAFSWTMFRQFGWLIDPSFPIAGAFVVYTAMTFFQFLTTDRDKRLIRRAFGHYVSPALLARIESSSEDVKLGGELRELSIMFTDMRNFSTISEALTPEQLLGVLNTMFGALGAEITSQSGTIDKFVGDAIMAFWNAPVDVVDHPAHACRAALAMRRRIRQLNAENAFGLQGQGRQFEEIVIGIGIATGEALVGNMGLDTRFDYSCVGDAVNVASRIEGACKTIGYDILIAEPTRAAVPGNATIYAGALALKGLTDREPVHLLVGDAVLAGSAEFAALRESHEALLAALAVGEDSVDALASCIQRSAAIDPHLADFYAMVESRGQDFRNEAELLVQ